MNMLEIRMDKDLSHLLMSKRAKNDIDETTPMIREKTLLTKELVNRFRSTLSTRVNDEIIPKNCRYIELLENDFKVIVIEEAPKIRTIKVHLSMQREIEMLAREGKLKTYGLTNFLKEHEDPPYMFSLSFPFLVYIFDLDNRDDLIRLKLFYRLSPIISKNDYLLQANLLNVNDKNNVCLGDFTKKPTSPSDVINSSIEMFWCNTFNIDYHHKLDAYIKAKISEVSSYLTWSYLTKQNPMFIFKVNWLKNDYTLGEEIKKEVNFLKQEVIGSPPNDFSFLTGLFYNERGFQVKTKEEDNQSRLNFSRSDSIFLENRELSVGETFKFEDKEVKVNSFLSSRSPDSSPTHIQVIDNKQETSLIKLEPEIMKFLSKQLDDSKFFSSMKLTNGEIIHVDDIVTVDYPSISLKKVEIIKLGLDGKVTVKLSGKNYIADNLNAKVVNLDKLDVGGVKLKKNHMYLLIYRSFDLPIKVYEYVKFEGLRVNEFGDLTIVFIDKHKKSYTRSLTDITPGNIYDKSKLTPVSTFRIGRRLYTSSNKDVYLTDNSILVNRYYQLLSEFSFLRYDATIAKADILKDKDRIEIKSFGLNIQFKVGDKVIVIDWLDPVQMLKVHQIVGFSLDTKNVFYINLKHKDEERSVPYIDFEEGITYTGLVRKITNCYNEIKSGVKIKAKVSGILGFPMKDTNIIVGFITDTGGPPLVLCSNSYTLWAFDLDKFEIIPRENPISWIASNNSKLTLTYVKQ